MVLHGWPRTAARLKPGGGRAFGERVRRHAAHLSGTICGAHAMNTGAPILRSYKLDDDDGCGDSGDRDNGGRGELAARQHVEADPPAAVGP